MANTVYDNFYLSNEIEDQYKSHLDLQTFCTVDNALEGTAGMLRKINVYKATDGTEKLAMGVGNSKSIEVGFTPREYRIQLAQNRFKYYDEQAMTDPQLVPVGTKHMGADMFNTVNADIYGEFAKATQVVVVTKFSVVKDSVLSFQEGDAVKLSVDGTDMFYGFVFTKSRSGRAPNVIEVTAYDQLRYFKNKDTYVYSNKKASDVIKMIAEDFGLSVGALEDTGYVIASRTEDNATLFDIAQNALDETLRAKTKLYVLYDKVGKLTLQDIESMKLNLLIDADTIGEYSYSSTIDKQTYNQIKITFENKDSGKREIFIAKDSSNINKWGLLQYTDTVELSASGAAKAEALLKLYNTKTRSLSISDALGDTRVRAGSSVIVKLGLGDINVQSYLLVESVTHKFKQEQHLMDLKLRGGTFVT